MSKTLDDILNDFGKKLDEHYGVVDFGCKGCKEIVAQAKSEIIEVFKGIVPEKYEADGGLGTPAKWVNDAIDQINKGIANL